MIPAYLERDNLETLIPRIHKTMKRVKEKYEILMIIQGNDGSCELLDEFKKEIKELRYYYYKEPLGVGKAFRIGFSKVNKISDYVITMDGDLNHQPEEIIQFIGKLKKDSPDIIIGSRRVKGGRVDGMSYTKKIISYFTTMLLNNIFRVKVKDITSGYRLYKKKVLDQIYIKTKSNNFEFYPELILIANLKKFKIMEIPIIFKVRIHGKSKLYWIKSGFGYLRLIFRSF